MNEVGRIGIVGSHGADREGGEGMGAHTVELNVLLQTRAFFRLEYERVCVCVCVIRGGGG